MKQLVAQSSSGIPPGAKTSCLKALVYSAGLLPVEVEFDKQIRNVVKGGVKGEVFLHKSCQPLDEAVVNQGHLWEGYPAEFGNECSGMCGV